MAKEDEVCFIDGKGNLVCRELPKHAQRVARINGNVPPPPPSFLVLVNGAWVGTTMDSGDAFIGNVFIPTAFKNRAEAITEALKHGGDSVETKLEVYESYGSFPEDRVSVWDKQMVMGRPETRIERDMRRRRENREHLELQNRIQAEHQAEYRTVIGKGGKPVKVKLTW